MFSQPGSGQFGVHAVPAFLLGAVERTVSLEHCGTDEPTCLVLGNACAERNGGVLLAPGRHPAIDGRTHCCGCGPGEHCQELLAAVPSDAVLLPDHLGEVTGEGDQAVSARSCSRR